MGVPNVLIERFVEGDSNALNSLIEEYKTDLYNLCFRLTLNKHDADDLFQQTWIKAIKYSDRFENTSFKAWLFKICVNIFRDDCRRLSRRRKYVVDEFESTSEKDLVITSIDSEQSVEEQMEKQHTQALIVTSINKLPEKLKTPVVLFYYQQLSYAEIAQTMQIPEGTVKSRISNAKKKLKGELEGYLNV